tara:strand:+ start:1475 stop:2173 length:699 start_codon:yes stop_codon:yes gene_type:complete
MKIDEKSKGDVEKPKDVSKEISKQNSKIGVIMVVSFVFLVVLIIVIVNFSTRGVDKYYFEYNNVKFTPNKNGVGFNMEFYVNQAQYPVIMSVRNDPRTLENISIDITEVKPMIEHKTQIYVAIDPEDNLSGRTTVAAKEIDYFIDNPYLFDILVNSAFLRPTNESIVPTDEQTIVNCDDSSEDIGIIWLRLGGETAIFEEDGCLVVQGGYNDEMEIIRAADRLYLTMLGIMS